MRGQRSIEIHRILDRLQRWHDRLRSVFLKLLGRRQEVWLLLSIVRRHIHDRHAHSGEYVESHEEQGHPQDAHPFIRRGAIHVVELQGALARGIQARNSGIRIAHVLKTELLVDQQTTETPCARTNKPEHIDR